MQITKKDVVLKIFHLLDIGTTKRININEEIENTIYLYKKYLKEKRKATKKFDYIRIIDLMAELAEIRCMTIGRCEDMFCYENKYLYEKYRSLKNIYARRQPKQKAVIKDHDKLVSLLQADIEKYKIEKL